MDGQKVKTSKFHRLHIWAHNHKSAVLFAAALALIISVGLVVLGILYRSPVYQEPANALRAPIPKKEVVFYSPLTGLKVADEPATKQQVTAIMLENSPDARPQSGLKDAGVVYEAIAEGGITRFLALYQQAKPGLIGPVRSVRPYYVEWAAPYDAAIAHIGGSKKALDEVRNGQYKDIDQFFNAGAYWRATDRYAPHNVYTNFERLDALNQQKGFTSSTFTGLTHKDDKPSDAPTAASISVNISSGAYNSAYTYDKASNSYGRSQGGAPHVDREAGAITPKVVVVLKVPTQKGFEDGWREQMQTSGSGQAYLFQDGAMQEVSWKKDATKAPLRLLDAAGKDVAVNRGQTWVTAIAPDKDVTWQ